MTIVNSRDLFTPRSLQQAVPFKTTMFWSQAPTVDLFTPGRRSTPSTCANASPALRQRPVAPLSEEEEQLISTVATLGARAGAGALLSVISVCRQYLTEPQQQVAVLLTICEPCGSPKGPSPVQ